MSKRRTRKEKVLAQVKKTQPLTTEIKLETENQVETSFIIKDLLKTGFITLILLFVLGMLIIYLKL